MGIRFGVVRGMLDGRCMSEDSASGQRLKTEAPGKPMPVSLRNQWPPANAQISPLLEREVANIRCLCAAGGSFDSFRFKTAGKSGLGKSRAAGFARDTCVASSAGLRVTTRLAEAGAFERTVSTTPKTALLDTGRAGVTTADWDSFSIRRLSARLKTCGERT